MAETTEISWADATFNPWIGCTKVSPACTYCYAEAFAKRTGKAKWGDKGTRVKTSAANWKKPLKWDREAAAAYGDACERYPMSHQPDPRQFRRRVFCASLADVWEEWDGPIMGSGRDDDQLAIDDARTRLLTLDDVRRELFQLIDATPWLDWLVLTKRPENIRRMWPLMHDRRPIFPGAPGGLGEPMPCLVSHAVRQNVWLGTTVENHAEADKRIPELLKCRGLADELFLSCEPLLGPIDLSKWIGQLDWVISGGESGGKARPSHPDWFRSLRDQCDAAGVPFHFKQHGEWAPTAEIGFGGRERKPAVVMNEPFPVEMIRVGKKAAGRLLDGVEHLAFPGATP